MDTRRGMPGMRVPAKLSVLTCSGVPARCVKGNYGDAVYSDGFSAVFVVLASVRSDLCAPERGRLAALRGA
jgi:hypothetical protein